MHNSRAWETGSVDGREEDDELEKYKLEDILEQ